MNSSSDFSDISSIFGNLFVLELKFTFCPSMIVCLLMFSFVIRTLKKRFKKHGKSVNGCDCRI